MFNKLTHQSFFILRIVDVQTTAQDPTQYKALLVPDPTVDADPNLTPDYGYGWQAAISGDTAVVGSYYAGEYVV